MLWQHLPVGPVFLTLNTEPMEKTREIFGFVLATIFTIGFFTLLFLLIFKIVPDENKSFALGLLTTVGVLETFVIKYYFDGNKETAAKNKMIYNSTANPEKPPITTADKTTTTTETTTAVAEPVVEPIPADPIAT